MGYMESHDEERLMYKNITYGNSSGTYNIKDINTGLKRMEQAATFFYTVPGPKMMWEFGELGYDVSINLGGRLGIKPTHWEYYNNPSRKYLFEVCKALIKLKKEEPVFSTNTFTIEAANTVKHIELLHASANAEIVGNFDVIDQSYTLTFPNSGTWYEFFSGDSVTLTGTTLPLTLKAGEYRLYASKKLTGFSTLATPVKQITQLQDNYVYPNPFTSALYFNKMDRINNIEVSDLQGKTITQISGGNLEHIDTTNLSPGFYFLKVQFKDGNVETYKVIKK